MANNNFPYIALGLGFFFLGVVIIGGARGEDGSTALPLLTILVVSEFSFFVTAIGAYISLKKMFDSGFQVIAAIVGVVCAGLAIKFLMFGIEYWPL